MFVSALVMTVASNFLTDALPLIIRPKPRGVSPFKNLDADGLPLVGLDEIGVSAFLSGREKHQHILGAGLNIAPIGGEAAIAFFKFQIHPWHQATTTKLGTAISSTPSDVMLRQRERANHDGSTSPVGRYVQAISAGILPSRGPVDNASTESKLRALAVIMDTLNEAAISLLRQALFDDPRSGNAKTSEFREFDAMADSSRPPKDISCSEEDMTSILGRLRDTKCFAFGPKPEGNACGTATGDTLFRHRQPLICGRQLRGSIKKSWRRMTHPLSLTWRFRRACSSRFGPSSRWQCRGRKSQSSTLWTSTASART